MVIAANGLYRYSLERDWDSDALRIGFVMLNPSTADATQDDPTIRRCISFASAWGYGALEVVNLFAYRATHPLELRCVADPVGVDNDSYLLRMQQRVQKIVVAWGNQGSFQGRNQAVLKLLTRYQVVYCLGLTRLGHPRHPLYVTRDTTLITFPACSLHLSD
jgi:hypothetical protein